MTFLAYSTSYYRQLAKAIFNMTGLTSLTPIMDLSLSWVSKKVSSCILFLHLLQFTSSFSFNENVARFLDRTPSLLELEVDSNHMVSTSNFPPPHLAPASIPQLEQFVGLYKTAELIVPAVR